MVVFAFDDTIKKTLSRLGNNKSFEWENPGITVEPPPEPVKVELPPRPTWNVPYISLACLLLIPVAAVFGIKASGTRWSRNAVAMLALLVAAGVCWPLFQWEIPSPLAAPPAVGDDQAQAIFSQLHQNTYRAFDYREEEAVYDALANSVDGDLLRDLYLQILQGLKMQEQGGAVSRIREVTLLEGKAEPLAQRSDSGSLKAGEADGSPAGRGFAYRCRWNVAGTVEHWGHIHSRTNQYEAVFAVEPRDAAWKITDVDVLDEQRVKFETSLREL
jgi:hypothetical protein